MGLVLIDNEQCTIDNSKEKQPEFSLALIVNCPLSIVNSQLNT